MTGGSDRQHLAQLPSTDEPALFGLHPNAAIAFGMRECRVFLDAIVSIQPWVARAEGAVPSHDLVAARAAELLKEVPSALQMPHASSAASSVSQTELDARNLDPFAAVLLQEVQRYSNPYPLTS